MTSGASPIVAERTENFMRLDGECTGTIRPNSLLEGAPDSSANRQIMSSMLPMGYPLSSTGGNHDSSNVLRANLSDDQIKMIGDQPEMAVEDACGMGRATSAVNA